MPAGLLPMRLFALARFAAAVVVSLLAPAAVAHAQGRSDVVTLANQDRITGEVVQLDRGRLKFDTDDAGTLYLEWDKLAGVVARRTIEVVTGDGRRFLGTLAPAPDRFLVVATPDGDVTLPMPEVSIMRQIGTSFWSKLDGAVDLGFSYTRSSGIAQLNLNWDLLYRQPAARTRLTASFTQTQTEESPGGDDRGAIEASYLRYPWRRWFVTGIGRFETNESLGLELRSQVGGAIGPRLVNSNRAQLIAGAGAVVNDEKGVDTESTRNVELLFLFGTSFFTYDRPRTNIDVDVQYYPSLSTPGRHRLQLDASARYELLKDFFTAVSMYNTYDSAPPTEEADHNDVGVVLSVGWSF